MKIKKSEETINAVLKDKANFHKKQLNLNCETKINEVSIKDILDKENIQFIDVRESHEIPKIEYFDVVEIPLGDLKHQLDKMDSNKQKAVFCQSGIRSKKAVSILRELNIQNCFSIKEGVSEINNIISALDPSGFENLKGLQNIK